MPSGRELLKEAALLFLDATGFLHMFEKVLDKVAPLVAFWAPEQAPEVFYPPVNEKTN